jgi:hypothetical protein
MMDPSED